MPCTLVRVTDYTTTPTSYESYKVCWPDDGGDDTHRPPDGPGSESGFSSGGGGGGPIYPPGFDLDPSGSGVVVLPDTAAPEDPIVDLNPGWNSGAFSIDSVPPDWGGTVSFDIPDVDGSRPAGVAVGFCAESQLPSTYRSGYSHLRYGLVFADDELKVIHEGVVVLTEAYATINAARTATGTDEVQALMYGDSIQWVVNGFSLYGGAFAMTEDYALDAVLYLAFDRVDNPKFLEGEWPDLDGQLRGILSGIAGSIAGLSDGDLAGDLPKLVGVLSSGAYSTLAGTLVGLVGALGEGDGIRGNIGPIIGAMSSSGSYTTLIGTIGPITGALAGDDSGVKFSAMTGVFPRFVGYMTSPATGRVDGALPRFLGRITAETTYSEVVGVLPGLRGTAYGGSMTPLIQVMEMVGYYAPSYISAYLTITATEYIQAASSAMVDATLTADAMEEITAQGTVTVLATMIDAAVERIGLGERVTSLVFRVTSGTPGTPGAPGALVDDGQAWAVVTGSNATTRYDAYGFNSFFALGGKHYGVRNDGVYLLEGADDAGQPITAGVALGKHDFGTQELKSLSAVYAGVSSTGRMLLRVGDGRNTYTYMARSADTDLRVQRFDTGRGLRTNYFTFDLVGEGKAFELDNVTFNVVASTRRI